MEIIFDVIDNDGKMIGIITDKDILKAALRKRSIASAYIPKEKVLQ